MSCKPFSVSVIAVLLLGLLFACTGVPQALAEEEPVATDENKVPLYLLDESDSGKILSSPDVDKAKGMWVVKQRFALNPEQDEDTIIGDSVWVELDNGFPTEKDIAAQASEVAGYDYVGYEVIDGDEPLVILTYVPANLPEEEKQFASELTNAANLAESAFGQASPIMLQEYDDSGEAGMTQEELDILNDMEEGFFYAPEDGLEHDEDSQIAGEELRLHFDDGLFSSESDLDSRDATRDIPQTAEKMTVSNDDVAAWRPASNAIGGIISFLLALAFVAAIVLGRSV